MPRCPLRNAVHGDADGLCVRPKPASAATPAIIALSAADAALSAAAAALSAAALASALPSTAALPSCGAGVMPSGATTAA